MEAKQSEFDDNLHVALEYLRKSSNRDPIYLSVTDMSKCTEQCCSQRSQTPISFFLTEQMEKQTGQGFEGAVGCLKS
mgnify:CR=1 FL=1